jgi:hypothetical protein
VIKKRTASGPRRMVSSDGLTWTSVVGGVIGNLSKVNRVY